MLNIHFWGTRLGLPVPGDETQKYGGNTACVTVKTDEGKILLLDCGSGMREFGKNAENMGVLDAYILVSALRWDRVHGLPFCDSFYSPKNSFKFCFPGSDYELSSTLKDMLELQMTYDFFPVMLSEVMSEKTFLNLADKDNTLGDFVVKPLRIQPEQPVFGYRVQHKNSVFVYLSEICWNDESLIPKFTNLASGSDLIITSVQSTVNQYRKNNRYTELCQPAVKFASSVNAKQLIFTNYYLTWQDSHIEKIVEHAKHYAETINSDVKISAAYEGLIVKL